MSKRVSLLGIFTIILITMVSCEWIQRLQYGDVQMENTPAIVGQTANFQVSFPDGVELGDTIKAELICEKRLWVWDTRDTDKKRWEQEIKPLWSQPLTTQAQVGLESAVAVFQAILPENQPASTGAKSKPISTEQIVETEYSWLIRVAPPGMDVKAGFVFEFDVMD
ncbi:MAG: hypothetical protein HQL54_04840 [Magnetococcales bacterium]|nr:hypothetical protein [Magnetococcales bacterium]